MTVNIPEIGIEEARAAVRYLDQIATAERWTPEQTAQHLTAQVIETVQNTAHEHFADANGLTEDAYDSPALDALDRLIAQTLDSYAKGLENNAVRLLGPNGKGWQDSGPHPLPVAYEILYSAARTLATNALSGPNADGLPRAFVQRAQDTAAAREGSF